MNLPKKKLKELYLAMQRIRLVGEKIAEIYPQMPRKIQCPTHLSLGQEAVAVGVCAHLLPSDYVFSFYRGHAHYLAKSGDMKGLMAELFGKKTGCSGGWGGSMHLIDPQKGFMGTTAIVAGQIPLAVGAALSFQMRGQKKVAVVFFGDGACEEGVWHESLNFASLKKLPVVFVCENNLYAVKARLADRQAKDNIFERAKNYGLPGVRVDGNDVVEVFETARQAVERARKGQGPSLIEARTYRWRQHCENTFFDQDILEGRPKKEYAEWLKRCPVKSFEKRLLKAGIIKKSEIADMKEGLGREINQAVVFAGKSPWPKINLKIK